MILAEGLSTMPLTETRHLVACSTKSHTRKMIYPMHIELSKFCRTHTKMIPAHENGSARPFAVPSLAPPRVRHGGNACVRACNVRRKQAQWKAQDKATGRAAKARKLSASQCK